MAKEEEDNHPIELIELLWGFANIAATCFCCHTTVHTFNIFIIQYMIFFLLLLARQCLPDVYSLKMYSHFHSYSRFVEINSRGRLLGRDWDKSHKSLPPSSSQSFLLADFTPPPPPLSKISLKLVCRKPQA